MTYRLLFFALLLVPIAGCSPAVSTEIPAENEPSTEAPLARKLEAMQRRFEDTAPPEKVKLYERGIETVRRTGIEDDAVQVYDVAPSFSLPDATGDKVSLDALLKEGPVVLVWYRGGWCPYCNLTLGAYQARLGDIRKAGGQLVAISPEKPDKSLTTKQKQDLQFHVLSDVGNTVARKYGLVFKLPPEVAAQYRKNIDLSAYNGDDSNELPLAATYVIDRSGIVRYAFVDADYRKRAEPAEVIEVLERLKE